jgi:RNA polymerase sigma-70 factor (ECF subfamily)
MARVVTAVVRSDAAATEAVVAEELDWAELVATVHRQMRSVVGTSKDLEDLTQTALEQVLRSIDRYEGRARLSTYTYRICVHVALHHWRWWRRWLRRFDLGIDDDPRVTGDAHDAHAATERTKRLHRALGKLEPARRLAVTLVDLEGLTAAEVAEITESPEGTVRTRLRQGRLELSAALRKDPYFQGEAR